MNTSEMKIVLEDNFEYIQKKIDIIKNGRVFDIKQIADLQRFVSMQREIIESLATLRELKL